MHRRSLLVIAPFLALSLLLTGAPAAQGHAVLVKTEPVSRGLVQEPPAEVTLTFSERVNLKLGGVEVFAPSGARVSRPAAVEESQLVSPIHAEKRGTYAVSWRVISADGHPVRGAFTFSVGRQTASSAAKRVVADAKTDRPLAIGFGVVRFLNIFGLLIAVGGVVFAAVVAPRWPPRFVTPALAIVIVASVLGFFLQAAVAADVGVLDTLDSDIIDAQLSTLYGNAIILRIVLAILCLTVLRLSLPLRWGDAPTRLLVAGVFVALAFSQSISGHAMATTPVALRLPLDMVHVLCAAVWLGGLVQLYGYVASNSVKGTAVARYSSVAFVSVVVLVSSGTYAALAESDLSLDALDTAYGRILLAKICLFALTLPIANLNRARHVPAIVAGTPEAPSLLRRFMRFEVAILLVVLGLTAWLIETIPARHALHRVSEAAGPVNEVRVLPSRARVGLTIEPAGVGANAITVRVRTANGSPDTSIDALRLTGSLGRRKITQLPLGLKRRARGLWTAKDQVLPLSGRWRFDIALRRGEFDEERTHVDADISRRVNRR